MKKIVLLPLFLGMAAASISPAPAANVTLKDAQKVSQTICAYTLADGSLAPCHALIDINGVRVDPATKGMQQQILSAIQAARTGDHVTVDAAALPAGASTEATLAAIKMLLTSPTLPTGAAADATLQAIKTALGNPYQAGGPLPLPAGASTESTLAAIKTLMTSPTLPTGAAADATLQAIKTALGNPYQAGGPLPLPAGASTEATLAAIKTLLTAPTLAAGAATSAKQDGLQASIGAQADPACTTTDATACSLIAATKQLNATLIQVKSAVAVLLQPGGKVDTIIQSVPTDIGATVVAATSTTLGTLVAGDRGWRVQNQTSGSCRLRIGAAATDDFHSAYIPVGGWLDNVAFHVGLGAINVKCVNGGDISALKF